MAKRRGDGFRHWHEAALVAILLVLFGLAHGLDPAFLSAPVQVDLSTLIWELALLALPMTLIIITGGIDLSIGASMSLSAVALGTAFEHGMPAWLCLIVALVCGSAAGLLNGVFVAYVRVHPLIVTLATMSAYYGIAEGVSHARPISGFPTGFTSSVAGSVGALPVPGLVFAVAAVAAAVFLGKTVTGQSLYAIGLNETATRFTGIAVDRIKLWLYTVSGSAAAIAAMLFVARRNTAKADIGMGMELDVITAVVLGGTSIYGGRGGIVGTLLGVVLIHETRQFVSWHWERDELNLIVVGSLLVVAVLANALFTKKREAS